MSGEVTAPESCPGPGPEVLRVGLVLEQPLMPVPGGTGRYSVQIARALAARSSSRVSGWTAWHRDVGPARVPGVAGPHRLPLPRRALITAWERSLGPRPHGVDVVHAPTLLAPPRGRVPLVVTVHDVVPWTHPETLTPRGARWHRAMAGLAAGTADAIVVPTAAVARELARHVPLRHPPEVVPLGASDLSPPADPEEVMARLRLPSGGYVLSLATAEPRKGLDVLVRAMADRRAPAVPLLLIGARGWGGVDPAAMAAASGLAADRVRHLGAVSDADLAVVLERATVLAVPSRAEGFGLPVVEAMAAGTAVVTSTDPALLEVGGDATVAVPVGDAVALAGALAQVVEDAGLRGRLVAAGRRRAQEFTWARTAESLAELYARLR